MQEAEETSPTCGLMLMLLNQDRRTREKPTIHSVVIAISKVRTPRINYLFQMKAFHLCQLSIQIQRFTFVVLAEIGS